MIKKEAFGSCGKDKIMEFQKARENDFLKIQKFYWDVIDNIHKNNTKNENLGWEKGAYPSDDFLSGAIRGCELYMLTDGDMLCASVIFNSNSNQGYVGCPWSIDAETTRFLYRTLLRLILSCRERASAKLW